MAKAQLGQSLGCELRKVTRPERMLPSLSLTSLVSLEKRSCNSVTPVKNLSGAKRYLVPEVDARTLETALRNQKASVDLVIQANGDTSMGMLYLDGIPWRDTLEK